MYLVLRFKSIEIRIVKIAINKTFTNDVING